MGFLAVIPIGLAIAVGFKKKFEETAAISIFLIILILYISGMVSTFIPGLFVVAGICVFSVCYIFFKCCKDHQIAWHMVLSGLVAFCGFAMYFMLICHHRAYDAVADYAHWGLAVKNMWLLNDFSNSSRSTDLMYQIPPASSIWAYFCTRNWITFSESLTLSAQSLFISILLLAIFPSVSEKYNWRKCLLIWTIILYVPLIFDKMAYSSLCPNALVGVLAAYIAFRSYKYMAEGSFLDMVGALMGTAVISLIHTEGFYFISILSIMIILFIVVYGNKLNVIENRRFFPFEILLMAAGSYLTWKLYLMLTTKNVNGRQYYWGDGMSILNILITFSLVLVFAGIVNYFDIRFDKIYIYVLLGVLLISNISLPFNLIKQRPEEKIFWGVIHSKISISPEDKFYYIDEDIKHCATNQVKFYYSIAPGRSEIERNADNANLSEKITANELEQYICEGQYNYLYINNLDNDFSGKYASLFQNPEAIGNGKLYKVTRDDTGKNIVLVLIGE